VITKPPTPCPEVLFSSVETSGIARSLTAKNILLRDNPLLPTTGHQQVGMISKVV